MAKPTISTRTLTKHLNAMGAELHTVKNDGTPVTREEALAELLWKKALGWSEMVRDDEGNAKTVIHKPESWAMQYVYERKEGKSVTAAVEGEQRIKASDRVRELAKARLNRVAVAVAVPLIAKGPPKFKPKG